MKSNLQTNQILLSNVKSSAITTKSVNNTQIQAKKLKQVFSIYEESHVAALGVLLQLDESKPTDFESKNYIQLFNNILEILAKETNLSTYQLLQAANKVVSNHNQRAHCQQFSYAALSFINRCGFKSIWDSDAKYFREKNFQLLLDEGVRIEICGVQKLVLPEAEMIVIQDSLGQPREWESRQNDYK